MVGPRRLGVVFIAALLGLALGGCGGGSDKAGVTRGGRPVALTLANFNGDSEELDGFVADVRRLSHGTLRIAVRNRWRHGQVRFEDGLIADVAKGKADLGIAGSRAWDSVGVDSLRALNAPLLIDSYALQERVLRSPLIAPMLRGLGRAGVQGIGVLPGPIRRPVGIVRPLTGPASYRGLTIGVQQSRVAAATLRALGARPVLFAVEGPIAGLGGLENQISSVQGNRYNRTARFLTANVALWPRPVVVFAGRSAYARLTPEQRGVLRQAVQDDISPETATLRANERTDVQSLCRQDFRFVTATPDQRGALRQAVQPVYDDLERDGGTLSAIAAIEDMRRSVPADAAPVCAPDTSRVGGVKRLDGVWRMTTRYGDEPGDPEPVPENYGDWVFVLDRGYFAFTQQYRDACTWGYGTYSLSGRRMAQTFTDGGGIAPTGAENKPGEFFRFGWSLYRDTLTLSGVKGAISPLNFRGRAWHRISTAPSRRYFAKRCPPPVQALPA